MIKVSSLFAQLGKAAQTATPSLADANLTIPGVLQPVITVPESLEDIPGVSTTVRLTSSLGNRNFSIANAGGSTATILSIGPGLWEVQFVLNYTSNYIGAGNDMQLSLQTATSGIAAILAAMNATGTAAVPVSRDQVIPPFRILTQVGILASITLQGNGAAQSHSINVSMLANRLA